MRRALTLTETAIAGILIGLMLVMVTLGVDTVRQDLKRRRTERVLAQLDRTLAAYHHATGRWPADPSGPATHDTPTEDDGSGDRIIAALAADPESRKVLERIPPAFRVAAPADGATASPTSRPWGTIQDAWGHHLRCLTADSPLPVDRDAVAANGGEPVFLSAGPDERFGPQDLPNAADNIRSDGR